MKKSMHFTWNLFADHEIAITKQQAGFMPNLLLELHSSMVYPEI